MNVKNFHGRNVIDSREVAEMVEKDHKNLLADIRGYIKIMENANELNFQPVDFFIETSYQDRKGETRPCYLITKKGCDMIANKITGKKGVLFTAAYVTAFDEMQMMLTAPKITALPEGVSLNGLARLLSITRRIMQDMGSTPVEIGLVAKSLYEGCGVPLNPAFSRQLPGQTSLFDRSALDTYKHPDG